MATRPQVLWNDRHGMWQIVIACGRGTTSPTPTHLPTVSVLLCLSVSLSLCLCVSVCLCLSVSLWLCVSVSLCLCVCVSARPCLCPCGLVHVCPVCPLGVPVWPWVSLCAPGCLCTPGCLWCLCAPADPLCPTVLPPHCATLCLCARVPTVALCPLGRLYPL